jgi:hypothetical protein
MDAALTMFIAFLNYCVRLTACLAVVVAVIVTFVSPLAAETTVPLPRVDCDFSGGNIILERIEGDNVYLRQDPRDTPGFWFYWSFRVREAKGRRLTFHFTDGNPIGVRGPAVSIDGGKKWSWVGADSVKGASFVYSFGPDVDKARFCLAMPYQVYLTLDYEKGIMKKMNL